MHHSLVMNHEMIGWKAQDLGSVKISSKCLVGRLQLFISIISSLQVQHFSPWDAVSRIFVFDQRMLKWNFWRSIRFSVTARRYLPLHSFKVVNFTQEKRWPSWHLIFSSTLSFLQIISIWNLSSINSKLQKMKKKTHNHACDTQQKHVFIKNESAT
jgi:hypothetical protein